MAKTELIAALKTKLDSYRQQLLGLQQALTATPQIGDSPDETMLLAQQRATLAQQIAALDTAIAVLEGELAQAQQQQAAVAAEQAIANDEAALATGRDRGLALAVELAAVVAAVEDALQRIGHELSDYNEPFRRKLRREMPNEYPSAMHRARALARVSAAAFLDGMGEWSLPALVQVGDRMELRSHRVDIHSPTTRVATSPGDGTGSGNHKTVDQAVVKRPIPAGADLTAQHLAESGFVGPSSSSAG